MKYGDINLIGELRVGGFTAGENQFLGLSGGALYWLDPVADTQGFSIYGSNYVFCNAITYSATASGEGLIAAYASASALVVSPTNRGAVIISPGIYDFDSVSLNLNTSYIDLVGLEPSKESVVLQASNATHTLLFSPGVDAGLYNLGLTGGSISAISGTSSNYFRWGNVEILGSCFPTDIGDLRGEFQDIKVGFGLDFASGLQTIDGVFDNIYGQSSNNIFQAELEIRGTYSNIEFGYVGFFLTAINNTTELTGSILSANLRDINLKNNAWSFVGLTSSLLLESSKIKASSLSILGGFDNIVIRDVYFEGTGSTEIISTVYSSVNGSFEQVEFINAKPFWGGYSIIGTFSNLKFKDCSLVFSIANENIEGNFNNIDIVNGDQIFTANNSIIGSFSRVTISDSNYTSPQIFVASTINADVYYFKIGDYNNSLANSSFYFKADTIYGNFDQIQIGSASNVDFFEFVNLCEGKFTNIKTRNLRHFFKKSSSSGPFGLVGDFYNISCGNVNWAFALVGDGPIIGSFSNITVGNVSFHSFIAGGDGNGTINCDLNNVKIGDVGRLFLNNAGTNMYLNVKNLSVGDVGWGAITNSNGIMVANLRNISFDRIGQNFLTSPVDYYVTVDNFKSKCGKTASYVFNTANNLYATVSNFIIDISESETNYFGAGNIYGTIENIYLAGTATSILSIATSSNIVVKNLNANGPLGTNSPFQGKISNSYLNSIGSGLPAITVASGSVINRCKFTSDGTSSVMALEPISSNIIYTATNFGIESNITNVISDNKNINNSGLLPGIKI